MMSLSFILPPFGSVRTDVPRSCSVSMLAVGIQSRSPISILNWPNHDSVALLLGIPCATSWIFCLISSGIVAPEASSAHRSTWHTAARSRRDETASTLSANCDARCSSGALVAAALAQ